MLRRTFFSIVTLLLAAIPAQAAKKPKAVEGPPGIYCVPAAVAPGGTTRVKFYNTPSDTATGLWTGFPAEVAPTSIAADPGAIRYQITVPADVPVGVYPIRLGLAGGAADLQLFMVDDLPSVARAAANTRPEGAQAITPPVAVDGNCEPLESDYFRFRARKGQRLSFEVVAQRMGSRLDPVVRLTDSSGRELAYVDDTPGLGADCRFTHTFDADGDFLLELHDAEYFGGVGRRYRLRVGDFPAVTTAFPAAGKAGTEATFAFEGVQGERVGPVKVQMAQRPTTQRAAVKAPDGKYSAFVSVMAGEGEEFVASVPNHERAKAAKIPIPATLSGRFVEGPNAQRDFYAFDAKKGEKLSIRGRTRSLGSPCNLSLQVLKADGTSLAASKPEAADEGVLDVTVPADGGYLLVVGELTGQRGPGVVYRLEISQAKPGFSLGVDVGKVDATAGSSFTLMVKCVRRKYDGPVALSLDGDAARFELKNAVIDAGKKEVDLEIKVPVDARTGRPLAFSVLGKGADGERIETANTAPAWNVLFPRLQMVPPGVDGTIGLGVKAK